mmetsp:Transcript_93943/g.169690  ORF Transcript_93943/g.169690 Transcript_93943/m.169690 type:complete len:130 (-) Transcript_93943:652-1041(-)
MLLQMLTVATAVAVPTVAVDVVVVATLAMALVRQVKVRLAPPVVCVVVSWMAMAVLWTLELLPHGPNLAVCQGSLEFAKSRLEAESAQIRQTSSSLVAQAEVAAAVASCCRCCWAAAWAAASAVADALG